MHGTHICYFFRIKASISSLLQNSKNILRPFGKLSAQGERYLDYSMRGELVEPPFPFVVSLSNHNSYFCKRLIPPGPF